MRILLTIIINTLGALGYLTIILFLIIYISLIIYIFLTINISLIIYIFLYV